jgi:hypothetical protein
VLILVILAAIAIDLSALSMAQRSLQDTVEAAADDAASMVDENTLRSSGEVILLPERAERVGEGAVEAASLPGPLTAPVEVAIDPGATGVTVTASVLVSPIFGVPLGSASRVVTATAHADVERLP